MYKIDKVDVALQHKRITLTKTILLLRIDTMEHNLNNPDYLIKIINITKKDLEFADLDYFTPDEIEFIELELDIILTCIKKNEVIDLENLREYCL